MLPIGDRVSAQFCGHDLIERSAVWRCPYLRPTRASRAQCIVACGPDATRKLQRTVPRISPDDESSVCGPVCPEPGCAEWGSSAAGAASRPLLRRDARAFPTAPSFDGAALSATEPLSEEPPSPAARDDLGGGLSPGDFVQRSHAGALLRVLSYGHPHSLHSERKRAFKGQGDHARQHQPKPRSDRSLNLDCTATDRVPRSAAKPTGSRETRGAPACATQELSVAH